MPLFDLEQHYENATPEWKRPTFKDCAAADITLAFFNESEHAEKHTVDGEEALIILEDFDMRDHSAHWEGGAKQNFDTGLYTGHKVLYISVKDYGDMPQVGDLIYIDEDTKDERIYEIKSCEDESGVYRMILERTRQG